MTVVKIILFCIGGFLLIISFCGSLMIASSGKASKEAAKLYKWFFIIGAVVTAIAATITFF